MPCPIGDRILYCSTALRTGHWQGLYNTHIIIHMMYLHDITFRCSRIEMKRINSDLANECHERSERGKNLTLRIMSYRAEERKR